MISWGGFRAKSGLPEKEDIYSAFKNNFPNIDIKYITLNDGSHNIKNRVGELPLKRGYVFKVGDKYYSVNPENPDYRLSNDNHGKELINNFCNDLIKESGQDILPNLLKDCKTINNIKQKLPNVGYEYDKTIKGQVTLKLGDVEFSVPFKKSLSQEDIAAISSITELKTMNGTPQAKTVLPPIGTKPNTLKKVSFESIELFDAESFKGIKIGGRSYGMCY